MITDQTSRLNRHFPSREPQASIVPKMTHSTQARTASAAVNRAHSPAPRGQSSEAERPRSAISHSEVAANRQIDGSRLIAPGPNRDRSPVKL